MYHFRDTVAKGVEFLRIERLKAKQIELLQTVALLEDKDLFYSLLVKF